MIGFILGIIYSSFLEWWVHKKLFHELGRKRGSFWAFHLREHHADCIKNNFRDDRVSHRETVGLLLLSIIHLPICLFSPSFYGATIAYAIAFIILHNYGHRNPEWAQNHQPWHWKHHMKSPNSNWNVVLPLADWIMRTNK